MKLSQYNKSLREKTIENLNRKPSWVIDTIVEDYKNLGTLNLTDRTLLTTNIKIFFEYIECLSLMATKECKRINFHLEEKKSGKNDEVTEIYSCNVSSEYLIEKNNEIKKIIDFLNEKINKHFDDQIFLDDDFLKSQILSKDEIIDEILKSGKTITLIYSELTAKHVRVYKY
jgi:hypothetical protein